MTDQNIASDSNKNRKRHIPWRNIGILFSTLGIILFISAFAFGYFELSKVNIALAQKVSDLENRMTSSQSDMIALQKSTENLGQAVKEIDVIKKQQEEILSASRSSQKGNFDKWQVAEAEYLVKLANDHLQLTHQYQMAIILLNRADQLLANLNDPNLSEIRQSIAKDIANVEALSHIDTTQLFLRLTAENVQLDHLPLPFRPVKDTKNAEKIEKPQPTLPNTSQLSWWDSFWNNAMNALSKIVTVRKNVSNQLPLVIPEEKMFLYQNLHAQLEYAKWALLNRNQPIYQTSLARALVWITQYFDQGSEQAKAMVQNLNELLKINIQPPDLNLDLTLQLFKNYFKNIP